MKKFEAIVIGTGPSGVMCAQKLVENKVNTLIIDYGFEIEQNKKKIINNLKSIDISQWNKLERNKLKSKDLVINKDFKKKYSYGSSLTDFKLCCSIFCNFFRVKFINIYSI